MKCMTVCMLAALTVCVFAFTACSLAPDYVRPDAPVPDQVSDGQAPALDGLAEHLHWETFFTDQRLQSLIRIGLENNRDVRRAALAVSEAAASYRVQRSERLPQLEAAGSGSREGDFRGNDTASYDVSAGLDLTLDVFGRLRSLMEAERATWLATAEAEKTVRLALVASVAQAYVDEILARDRRDLSLTSLESWRSSYAFIESRLLSGQSSLLELEQANSMVEAAAAALAEREREVIRAENALQLLLGTFEPLSLPDRVPLGRLAFGNLPSRVPSSVLLARPDVMEAEYALQAANADIGAARAAFFPSITLTGGLGYMSDDLGSLVSGSTGFWNFMPRISVPLFTAGRNRANLDLAALRKESAVAAYERSIQTAFSEVADALQTRLSFDRQIEAQKRYLESQRLVEQLALNRYANGAVSYLEVLDAQRAIFSAEQDLAVMLRDRLSNDINLFAALGGGAPPFMKP